ncbi:MAG: type II toxin-antitoxin system VapC family toxin [Nitrospirales bacterium]|nr:type II toxin-antitoxin system VapC family toxin [Nitrospirales bacterium]
MNLDDIPSGSLCVVDTNVLLYAEQGTSLQAQRLLRRIEKREVLGVMPQPVWQELMHKLMLAEALMLGHLSGGNPARQLAGKPDVIKRLTLYKDKMRALVTLGMAFEPCTRIDLVDKAVAIQERHGLLTNDSVIVAMALRLEADVLVSADKQLQGIKEVQVYGPSDVKLRFTV